MRDFKINETKRGFTLIELAIVLVIIGLIVGGVLVGQDLIRAAGVRATISQIEKFNTAANTFRGKYGFLPGDIKDPEASSFGLAARGTLGGEGDGNGILMGNGGTGGVTPSGMIEGRGETAMFWVDLTAAHLIEGGFNTASSTAAVSGTITLTSSPPLSTYFPQAKIGRENFIYVWSGGVYSGVWTSTGVNYFGISSITSIGTNGTLYTNPALTVKQAYDIDTKVDDGFAQSGRVTAYYVNEALNLSTPVWAAGGGTVGASAAGGPTTNATPGSVTTCYDNGGNPGTQQTYSIEITGGGNINCAISFQFQ